MSDEQQQPDEQQEGFWQKLSANRGLTVLIAIAIVGVILIIVFGVLLLRSLNAGGGDVAEGGTATPFAVSPVDQGGSGDALVVGVSDSSTVTVTMDMPVSLQVDGRSYTVQSQTLTADGLWSAEGVGEGTAVWVYGSIINYVLGIPYSNDNKALLEQLVPGDEIVLNTRAGTQYRFVFDSRDLYAANDRDIFTQTSPGITLALLRGDNQERLIVHGTYVVPEASSSGAGDVFSLGETAQLENLQVTVTGATYIPDRPEIPQGFAFVLIDYQLQNLALTALDTGNLQMLLLDELGNQYALSGIASQLGNNPPLSGFLNANQIVQATVGYQVPIGLTGETLNWVVRRANTGSQVTVAVPFPGGSSAAASASVMLQSATVSPDGTSLMLAGQVINLGDQLVVVSEQDVSLRTNDGATYLLLATNPAFPWSVNAGQSVNFVVTYQRPLTADTAVFTLLNQPFQLSALR
ncbi:MAG: DUF4352 domain-containing protein [Ardenticatenaceae bacterium]|nr:DUF4352 domain-containing protein [Anaerolineales bacterium]MCB8922080.1 DUF4352 domain-containing protein [Ardenticatenaceae bacterium]MCB9003196.1 DUF4352 domain-containing protein [Ardenticatenaceae bacterium]